MLDGAKLVCLQENGEPYKTIDAKGKKFSIGYLMDCDHVIENVGAEQIHCQIECDAFGHVTIYNKSQKNPISVNGETVAMKRTLFSNSKIKILDKEYLWQHKNSTCSFDATTESTAGMSTPTKQIGIPEQPPNSCPALKHHREVPKRFTVHNLRAYRVDSAANVTMENDDSLNQESASPIELDCTPAKVDLVDSTKDKKTSSTEKRLKAIRNSFGWSGMTTTSYSPRETGVRIEKTFTAIIPPKTPRSTVCRTPKGLLERIHLHGERNDTTNPELLSFATPTKTSDAQNRSEIIVQHARSAMKVVDLTAPSKILTRCLSNKKPTVAKSLLSEKKNTTSSLSVSTPKIVLNDTPTSTASVISVDSSSESDASEVTDASAVTSTTPVRSQLPMSSVLRKQALLASAKKQVSMKTAHTPKTPANVSLPERKVGTAAASSGLSTQAGKSATTVKDATVKQPVARRLDISSNDPPITPIINKGSKPSTTSTTTKIQDIIENTSIPATSTPYKTTSATKQNDSIQQETGIEQLSILQNSHDVEPLPTKDHEPIPEPKEATKSHSENDDLLKEIEEILNTSDEIKKQLKEEISSIEPTPSNSPTISNSSTSQSTVAKPVAVSPETKPASYKTPTKNSITASIILKALSSMEKEKEKPALQKEDEEKENKINDCASNPPTPARRRISISTTAAASPVVTTAATVSTTPKSVAKGRNSLTVDNEEKSTLCCIDEFNTENMGSIVEEDTDSDPELEAPQPKSGGKDETPMKMPIQEELDESSIPETPMHPSKEHKAFKNAPNNRNERVEDETMSPVHCLDENFAELLMSEDEQDTEKNGIESGAQTRNETIKEKEIEEEQVQSPSDDVVEDERPETGDNGIESEAQKGNDLVKEQENGDEQLQDTNVPIIEDRRQEPHEEEEEVLNECFAFEVLDTSSSEALEKDMGTPTNDENPDKGSEGEPRAEGNNLNETFEIEQQDAVAFDVPEIQGTPVETDKEEELGSDDVDKAQQGLSTKEPSKISAEDNNAPKSENGEEKDSTFTEKSENVEEKLIESEILFEDEHLTLAEVDEVEEHSSPAEISISAEKAESEKMKAEEMEASNETKESSGDVIEQEEKRITEPEREVKVVQEEIKIKESDHSSVSLPSEEVGEAKTIGNEKADEEEVIQDIDKQTDGEFSNLKPKESSEKTDDIKESVPADVIPSIEVKKGEDSENSGAEEFSGMEERLEFNESIEQLNKEAEEEEECKRVALERENSEPLSEFDELNAIEESLALDDSVELTIEEHKPEEGVAEITSPAKEDDHPIVEEARNPTTDDGASFKEATKEDVERINEKPEIISETQEEEQREKKEETTDELSKTIGEDIAEEPSTSSNIPADKSVKDDEILILDASLNIPSIERDQAGNQQASSVEMAKADESMPDFSAAPFKLDNIEEILELNEEGIQSTEKKNEGDDVPEEIFEILSSSVSENSEDENSQQMERKQILKEVECFVIEDTNSSEIKADKPSSSTSLASEAKPEDVDDVVIIEDAADDKRDEEIMRSECSFNVISSVVPEDIEQSQSVLGLEELFDAEVNKKPEDKQQDDQDNQAEVMQEIEDIVQPEGIESLLSSSVAATKQMEPLEETEDMNKEELVDTSGNIGITSTVSQSDIPTVQSTEEDARLIAQTSDTRKEGELNFGGNVVEEAEDILEDDDKETIWDKISLEILNLAAADEEQQEMQTSDDANKEELVSQEIATLAEVFDAKLEDFEVPEREVTPDTSKSCKIMEDNIQTTNDEDRQKEEQTITPSSDTNIQPMEVSPDDLETILVPDEKSIDAPNEKVESVLESKADDEKKNDDTPKTSDDTSDDLTQSSKDTDQNHENESGTHGTSNPVESSKDDNTKEDKIETDNTHPSDSSKDISINIDAVSRSENIETNETMLRSEGNVREEMPENQSEETQSSGPSSNDDQSSNIKCNEIDYSKEKESVATEKESSMDESIATQSTIPDNAKMVEKKDQPDSATITEMKAVEETPLPEETPLALNEPEEVSETTPNPIPPTEETTELATRIEGESSTKTDEVVVDDTENKDLAPISCGTTSENKEQKPRLLRQARTKAHDIGEEDEKKNVVEEDANKKEVDEIAEKNEDHSEAVKKKSETKTPRLMRQTRAKSVVIEEEEEQKKTMEVVSKLEEVGEEVGKEDTKAISEDHSEQPKPEPETKKPRRGRQARGKSAAKEEEEKSIKEVESKTEEVGEGGNQEDTKTTSEDPSEPPEKPEQETKPPRRMRKTRANSVLMDTEEEEKTTKEVVSKLEEVDEGAVKEDTKTASEDHSEAVKVEPETKKPRQVRQARAKSVVAEEEEEKKHIKEGESKTEEAGEGGNKEDTKTIPEDHSETPKPVPETKTPRRIRQTRANSVLIEAEEEKKKTKEVGEEAEKEVSKTTSEHHSEAVKVEPETKKPRRARQPRAKSVIKEAEQKNTNVAESKIEEVDEGAEKGDTKTTPDDHSEAVESEANKDKTKQQSKKVQKTSRAKVARTTKKKSKEEDEADGEDKEEVVDDKEEEETIQKEELKKEIKVEKTETEDKSNEITENAPKEEDNEQKQPKAIAKLKNEDILDTSAQRSLRRRAAVHNYEISSDSENEAAAHSSGRKRRIGKANQKQAKLASSPETREETADAAAASTSKSATKRGARKKLQTTTEEEKPTDVEEPEIPKKRARKKEDSKTSATSSLVNDTLEIMEPTPEAEESAVKVQKGRKPAASRGGRAAAAAASASKEKQTETNDDHKKESEPEPETEPESVPKSAAKRGAKKTAKATEESEGELLSTAAAALATPKRTATRKAKTTKLQDDLFLYEEPGKKKGRGKKVASAAVVVEPSEEKTPAQEKESQPKTASKRKGKSSAKEEAATTNQVESTELPVRSNRRQSVQSETQEADAVTTEAADVEQAEESRKVETTTRTGGRRRKLTESESSETVITEKRHKPAKSQESTEDVDAAVEVPVLPKKSTRGRTTKRKEPTTEAAVATTRRKQTKANNSESEMEAEIGQIPAIAEEPEVSSTETTIAAAAPPLDEPAVKRGRGRPQKQGAAESIKIPSQRSQRSKHVHFDEADPVHVTGDEEEAAQSMSEIPSDVKESVEATPSTSKSRSTRRRK